MGDAPAAAVFCGEMCNGCKDDCAACATMACGDCGGCEHGRELSRRARAAGATLALLRIGGVPAEFGFNPGQKRGPDGRFIKMGGRGSAGKGGLPKGSGLKNPRVDGDGRPVGSSGGGAGAGGTDTRAPEPLAADDRGPRPVGFTPRSDKDWNLTQKRLNKRTPRTDPDGDLQPGDIVPTKDGKWAEVLGRDTSKFWERNGLEGIRVRDDAKGYVNSQSSADIKKRIEEYAAEKTWRDAGGSSDRLAGVSTAPVNAEGLRPGEPPIGEDGKYAKPVTMYATHNGETYTRNTRNPYRYAAVVAHRDDPQGSVWSWHRTAESAQRGTLTSDQRRGGVYVKNVVETQFTDPNEGTGGGAAAVAERNRAEMERRNAEALERRDRQRAEQAQLRAATDDYNSHIEAIARSIRDDVIDERNGEGSGPFGGYMDRYKERELSDRLQELVDAREAGNVAMQDRVIAQIRKILLDTETQLESDLPKKP